MRSAWLVLLAAVPVLSSEAILDDDVSTVSAPRSQSAVQSAFDGTNHLVVWKDERFVKPAIMGALLSPAGAVQGAPFRISSGPADDVNAVFFDGPPAVAFDGTRYLVAWTDYRDGATGDVYAARVSTAGVVLDTAGIAVSIDPGYDARPAVAAGADGFVVAWQRRSGTLVKVHARLVDGAGAAAPATAEIGDSSDLLYASGPDASFDGTSWLVVWSPYGEVRGSIVTAAGTLSGAAFTIASTTAEGKPSVSWDGTNWLVAYHADVADGGNIAARFVSPAGTPGATVSVYAGAARQHAPSVVWDGSRHVIAWEDRRGGNDDVYAARVQANGTVDDVAGVLLAGGAGAQIAPALAAHPTGYLALFEDDGGVSLDLAVAAVDSTLVAGAAAGFVTAANAQDAVSIATDGSEYLVVWEDTRNGADVDVYGVRLDAQGAPIGSSAIAIATMAGDQIRPSVGFDGTDYLVVWEDHRGADADVYGARVTTGGSVLDVGGFPIAAVADSQVRPSAGGGPGVAFVTWADRRNGSYPDQWGARIASGAVVGTAMNLTGTALRAGGDSTVTFGDGGWLAAWSSITGVANGQALGSPRAARVTTGGVVLGGGSFALSSDTVIGRPAASFDGSGFLVVVVRYSGTDLYAIRVAPDGTISPSSAAVAQPGRQTAPVLAFDGTDHLLVWQDDRAGAESFYATSITPAGAVVDSAGAAVLADGNDVVAPSLVARLPGQLALAFSHYDPALGARRARASLVRRNLAPVAQPLEIVTEAGTPVDVTLSATDPDGDPLSWAISTQPSHGTLSGTAPSLVYTADAGFTGADSFEYTASDGASVSAPALVSITVTEAEGGGSGGGGCSCALAHRSPSPATLIGAAILLGLTVGRRRRSS